MNFEAFPKKEQNSGDRSDLSGLGDPKVPAEPGDPYVKWSDQKRMAEFARPGQDKYFDF